MRREGRKKDGWNGKNKNSNSHVGSLSEDKGHSVGGIKKTVDLPERTLSIPVSALQSFSKQE